MYVYIYISWRQPPPQSSSYTATYHPSRKLSKLDEPDAQDTAGEIGTSLWVMYSCGSLHMDEQRQDVQFEPTYSSSVPIRDVALRVCRNQWTIGRCRERRSWISALIAWHEALGLYKFALVQDKFKSKEWENGLIDFKRISQIIHLGLFYACCFGNLFHCKFIFMTSFKR